MIRNPVAPGRRARLGAAMGCAAALALAGCGSTPTPSVPPAAATSSAASSAAGSSTSGAVAATVTVGQTSLGDVVVDAEGRTLYMFTKDTKGSGKSACTGQCLVVWPPLIATGTPTAMGVTGTLGTIDTPQGKQQVTLDGWPLYTYAKDAKPGDATGQNVGQVWFVLDKTGAPVKNSPSTTTGY